MFEVHLFQATASATLSVTGPYKPENRHAMLAFLRQAKDTDHDWGAAEAGIADAGWGQIKLTRAGTLNAENLNGKSEDFRDAFEFAINGGCGLVVYADPVEPAQESA